jgi:hypothetical protein
MPFSFFKFLFSFVSFFFCFIPSFSFLHFVSFLTFLLICRFHYPFLFFEFNTSKLLFEEWRIPVLTRCRDEILALQTIHYIPYKVSLVWFNMHVGLPNFFPMIRQIKCVVYSFIKIFLRIRSVEVSTLVYVIRRVYHWGQSRVWVTWCQSVNARDHQTPDWWTRPRHELHSNTISLFINDSVRNHVCSCNSTLQESNIGLCIKFCVSTAQTDWRAI